MVDITTPLPVCALEFWNSFGKAIASTVEKITKPITIPIFRRFFFIDFSSVSLCPYKLHLILVYHCYLYVGKLFYKIL